MIISGRRKTLSLKIPLEVAYKPARLKRVFCNKCGQIVVMMHFILLTRLSLPPATLNLFCPPHLFCRIRTDSRDCCYNLAELKFVEDGGFPCGIETNYDDKKRASEMSATRDSEMSVKKKGKRPIYHDLTRTLYGKEGVGVEGGERLRVTEPRKRAGIDVHKAFSICNSATNKSWILTLRRKREGKKKRKRRTRPVRILYDGAVFQAAPPRPRLSISPHRPRTAVDKRCK